MTYTLQDAIDAALRIAEARKRGAAAARGQATRRADYPTRAPLAELRRLQALRKAGQNGQLASSWSRIRMVVSPWYSDIADPPGVLTRTVRAAQ